MVRSGRLPAVGKRRLFSVSNDSFGCRNVFGDILHIEEKKSKSLFTRARHFHTMYSAFFQDTKTNRLPVRRATYIYHGYLLRTRAWVIGSVGQVTVWVVHIHVLPHVIVHLLPLFPGGEATVRQCHSLIQRPTNTFNMSHSLML